MIEKENSIDNIFECLPAREDFNSYQEDLNQLHILKEKKDKFESRMIKISLSGIPLFAFSIWMSYLNEKLSDIYTIIFLIFIGINILTWSLFGGYFKYKISFFDKKIHILTSRLIKSYEHEEVQFELLNIIDSLCQRIEEKKANDSSHSVFYEKKLINLWTMREKLIYSFTLKINRYHIQHYFLKYILSEAYDALNHESDEISQPHLPISDEILSFPIFNFNERKEGYFKQKNPNFMNRFINFNWKKHL